jgi:TolB protein
MALLRDDGFLYIDRMNLRTLLALTAVGCLTTVHAARPATGIFGKPADVGVVSRPASASFDKATGTYTLGASGRNIWGEQDAFGFLASPARGDVSFAANVSLVGESAEPHRKAGLMLRASRAPDAAYVDVAVHGNGLTSLQYRLRAGGPTREIQCAQVAPTRVRLQKRGEHVLLSLGGSDGRLWLSGCVVRIDLGAQYQAGLFVTAHAEQGYESANFSAVELAPLAKPGRREVQDRFSAIEIVPLDSLDRRLVFRSTEFIRNVRFTRDGTGICYLGNTQLQRLPLPPGSRPQLLEANAPECIPSRPQAADGERWNYFHAKRGKEVHLWRNRADGSGEVQLTHDDYFNWYPQLSPDGTSLVFLSSRQPAWDSNMPEGDYLLRQMPAAGGEIREIARVFANSGTLAMPAWSPDGKSVVFIGYEPPWELAYAKRGR